MAAPAKQPAKPKATALSIALTEFDGLATTADKLSVERDLRALLPAMGYAPQPREQTQQTLADVKKLGLTCASGIECALRTGALDGANVVLKGVLSPEGDGFRLDLVAADVDALAERASVSSLFVPREEPERSAALDSALTGVLRPDLWRGVLKVTVAQRGASIYVEGAMRGISPLSKTIVLKPGSYNVFIGLEGFRPHKETVQIAYGKETVVDATLSPGTNEEPPSFTAIKNPPAPEVLPEPPQKRGPMRVVMYDVEAVGVPDRVARYVGALLTAELRKREGVSVLDSSELRALVGDGDSTTGDVRGCSEDQCFAEVAEALGADVVVTAQLTQIEAMVLFGLRRIDQKKQEVAGSFLERVPADDSTALLPLVGQSVATVFADVPLRAGQKAGVDDRAAKVLNPPPLPPVLTGSLYVASAVGVVTGVVAVTAAAVTYAEYDRKLSGADNAGAGLNQELQTLAPTFYTAQLTGIIGLCAGAALALGAAALTPLTDWEGYGDEVVTP